MAVVWTGVCVMVLVVSSALAVPDPRRAAPGRLSRTRLTNYLNRQQSHPIEVPQEVPDWPDASLQFGQVSGVDVTPSGDVIIFHRGSRPWTEETFEEETNVLPEDQRVPIGERTIVRLDSQTGEVLDSFGNGSFYVPHGITVDKGGNLWLTDVGTHQVYRIPRGEQKPDLVLGEKFVPGNDDRHFCKPTDVAVASNGDFYVSDGYCNARVIKFSSTGLMLGKIGMDVLNPAVDSPYSFGIPHSLALVEELDILCVADREHQRALCYNAGLGPAKMGRLNRTLVPGGDIGRVYGLAYDPNREVMHVAALLSEKPVYDRQGYPYSPARAFTFDLNGHFLADWDYITPREAELGPSIRHDIAVSPDGNDVYLAEVLQRAVRKFTLPPADDAKLLG